MKKMKHTLFGCALTALLCAALLIVGCSQDEEALPTGSTAFSSSSELARATAPLAHKDSDSDDSESEDDDSEDSESEDDDSEDSESVDDDSEDSESVDDDSVDDDSLDDNGTRVRDLLFAFAGCPDPPTLTIGATSVMTTEATRFDCEPGCDGLEERLTAAEFCSYLTLGLPMRARGTDNGIGIDASRVRIDDEIKATGVISKASSDLSQGFELTVDVLVLLFEVDPGAEIDVFDAGATVRVEGIVPVLSLAGPPTYIATEIEN